MGRITGQDAATRLPNPYGVFRLLTLIGFSTQWLCMVFNGSFMAMWNTFPAAAFPAGTPLKTVWTGIFPLDWLLTLLVVFFGVIANVHDLPDIGPHLMLVDLVYALGVFNLMTVVEDRRNRKTGPLRYPAYWQFGWNGSGAASILPIYLHNYLTKRSTKPLPADQAQALPFTSFLTILLSLPLLLPGVVGTSPFTVQNLVVLWFFLPLALGPFQDLVARCFFAGGSDAGGATAGRRSTAGPVVTAYWVAGAFSAAVHLCVVAWAWLAPDLSVGRVYWPDHGLVAARAGSAHALLEGAMLFMQYDLVVISLCVAALGAYTLGLDGVLAARSPAEGLRLAGPLLALLGVTVVGGPGAGIAWLMCTKERELAEEAQEGAAQVAQLKRSS